MQIEPVLSRIVKEVDRRVQETDITMDDMLGATLILLNVKAREEMERKVVTSDHVL